MILLPMMRWKADEEILDQREAIDTALARLALPAMAQKNTEGTPRTLTEFKIYVRNRVSATIFAAYLRLN